MKIDPSLAFQGERRGFSIWDAGERGFQASIKVNDAFRIGYGPDPVTAFENALAAQYEPKVDKPKRHRDIEDLA